MSYSLDWIVTPREVREDAHARANGATGVRQGAGLVPPATPPQPSW